MMHLPCFPALSPYRNRQKQGNTLSTKGPSVSAVGSLIHLISLHLPQFPLWSPLYIICIVSNLTSDVKDNKSHNCDFCLKTVTQWGESATQSGVGSCWQDIFFFLRIFYCHFLDIFVSLELEGIGAGGRSHHIFIPHCIFRDYEKQETEQRMGGLSKVQEER